jgi:rubrerythrin
VGVSAIFLKLKDMERRAGELYKSISAAVEEMDPEISQLFSDLAADERIHEKQVELAQNIFMEARDSFLEEKTGHDLVDEVLETIDREKKTLRVNAGNMTPQEMVRIAVRVEVEMENRHHEFYFHVKDEALKNLFQSLKNADHAHIGRIKNYLNNRKR